jgi:mRNA interferase MazF
VRRRGWIPDRGEAIWLDFDPQAGREQAGRRPAIVLSPAAYNARSGLVLVCPVTSKSKGYPFETELPDGLPIRGVVLSDHLRSLDWQRRRAEQICELPDAIIADVLAKIIALLGAGR